MAFIFKAPCGGILFLILLRRNFSLIDLVFLSIDRLSMDLVYASYVFCIVSFHLFFFLLVIFGHATNDG